MSKNTRNHYFIGGAKRLAACLLCLAMIATCAPLTDVYAFDGGNDPNGYSVEEDTLQNVPEAAEAEDIDDEFAIQTESDEEAITEEDASVPEETVTEENASVPEEAEAEEDAIEAEDDGDELFGNDQNLCKVSLSADEGIETEVINLDITFLGQDNSYAGSCDTMIHPGLVYYAFDDEEKYRFSRGNENNIPEEAKYAKIKVYGRTEFNWDGIPLGGYTVDLNSVDDDQNKKTYIKINDTAIELTDKIKRALTSDEGYKFELPDDSDRTLDVSVHVRKFEEFNVFLTNNPADPDYRHAQIYLLEDGYADEYEELLSSYHEWEKARDAYSENHEGNVDGFEPSSFEWPVIDTEQYRIDTTTATLTKGETYYIEVVPDYGYQIGGTYGATGTTIEGTLLTPTAYTVSLGTWSFTAQDDHFLASIVKKVGGTDGYDEFGNIVKINHNIPWDEINNQPMNEIVKIKGATVTTESGSSNLSAIATRGGTLCTVIEDDREDKLNLNEYATFGFSINGERFKGLTVNENEATDITTPWGFYFPERPNGQYAESVKVALTLNNDADADDYSLVRQISTKSGGYQGIQWPSSYDKDDKTLTFVINESGTFSIVPKNTNNDTFNVSFNTQPNKDKIGCVPYGGDFIPQNQWNGYVPVRSGGSFSFRFNVNDGYKITKVTAIPEGGAESEALIPYGSESTYTNGGKKYTRTGIYTIDNVTADTEIRVYSTNTFWVSFNTRPVNTISAESVHNIGCVPTGGDYIPQDPWNGGVPVASGGSFSFRFNVNEGYGITKVTVIPKGGKESEPLIAEGKDKTIKSGKTSYVRTGVYTINNITANTEIRVYSSETVWVSFNTQENVHEIGCQPTGGDYFPQDPWTGGVPVAKGGSFSFRFNPNAGYVVTEVMAIISETNMFELYPDGAGEYTLNNIDEPTEIRVDSAIPAFDLSSKIAHYQEEERGITVEPAGDDPTDDGLIDAGDGLYKYNGNPDGIKLLVKENGSPIEGLSRFKNGFLSRYMLNMFTGFTVDNEEIPFNFYINDDGTVEIPLNDPGAWDHDYQNPIQWMTRYATENQGGTIYASGNWDDSFRPARRVVFVNNLDEDAVEYDFGEHPPITIEDGLYYINDDAKDISFTLNAKSGYKLTSVKYRTVNMTIDENGELSYEEANSYTGTTKLEKGPDGKYKITLDEPHEGDEWSNLGVEITVNVTKDAEVTLALASNEGYHDPLDAKLFNWGVRVDSRTYPVEYDDVNQVYKAYVPVDSTVTVSMSSKDDLWTVSEAYPEDASKNNGKKVAASKSGEYTLEVADSATLTARIAQVTRIVVTESTVANDDNPEKEAELEAVKNAYTIKKADKFRAFLASGSHFAGENLVPNIVMTANFFNGTKPIDAGLINNGVLTAEAENLDLKNDKLALKVTNGTKSYSTTINFTKPTTAIVTSPKETDQGVVVPYGQKAVIQVSVDGNAKNVKAEIRKYVGYDDINKKPITELLCNVTDLGTFDGKTITIYPVKALRHPEGYFPNKYFLLYFFDDQGVEIGESSLYYSAPPIHDKTAPTIKEKADLSSNQSIGLSLALPKQVKAVDGMYYMLEATVCEDAKGNDQTAIVNGAEEHYFANLAYFDDHNDEDPDNDEIVRVYKENVTTFVPASEKTWSLDVSDAPRGKEDGRALSYNVKATMVYASEKNGVLTVLTIDDIEDGEKQKSETSVEQEMSTKDNTYETKLALTKKLPSKIYNTQNGIPVAVPKWSKNASVQGLDRVELINSYGNVNGHWSRWDDNGDMNTDNDSFLLNVDEDGLITLDTAWVEIINEGLANEERFDHNLEAGKYTIAAYAIGGPGQEAMATVPVTLLESIHSLYVATPTRILKNYNKAAKVSTELFYNINEREGVPATKAVEWSLAVPDPLNPGEYIDIPEYSPLYGMLTIKNGTVDIDKALLVDYAKKIPVPGDPENSRNLGPEDYKFVVGAKAADFEGNTVITYSSPVQITSESQIPTEIQFVWDEYRWDDNEQKEVFLRRNYSPITEEEIARREAAEKAKDRTVEPFYSNAIHNSQVIVLDQYGEQMYASLKLTGIKQDENGKLILSKPGSITVVATSCDGGKKSKQLKFKIAEGDVRFDPNVLIQDSTLNVMDNYEHSFINIGGSDTPWDVYGADECFNNMPANKYVYVHVAAVKTGNINMYGGQLGLDKWGGYDFGNNVMFNHSVKVTGGSIKATRTDMFDNYTTYVILPSAADTVITLTDNTVDKTLGRAKTTLTYTIHNTAISADKSRTITADKASILNWMYVRSDAYPEPAQNPNHVTYTIKDAEADAAAYPGRTFAALITMDDLTTDAQFTISRFIGMSDDIADDDERINMEIDGRDDLKDRIQKITDDDGISNEEKEERIGEIRNYVKDIIKGRNEAGGVIKYVNDGKFSIDFFRPVIDENNGQEYYDFWETPAGTYSFYATYGYIEGGQFKPLAPATKLSVKTAAAAVPTVKLASTTIKLNADSSTISVGLPEAAKGLGVIPYYELRNLNTNGVTDNQFSNLFRIGIDNADIDKPVIENAMTLDLISDDELDLWIDVVSGKNVRSVHIKSWNDLKMLKTGQFKTKADDEHPDDYNPEGNLVFTAANQKSAYQKFVKENCTGFLRLRSLGYDGRERDVDIKITVNIDSFLGN